jgi:hypothetical protein
MVLENLKNYPCKDTVSELTTKRGTKGMISYIFICISIRTCIIRVMSRTTETHMFVVTGDSVTPIANSPIKTDMVLENLKNYPCKDTVSELTEGFLNGFRLHYAGPRFHRESSNLV